MKEFWQGKKVFLTGHTGFKGAWLSLWLLHLGADVMGLSLKPHTNPSLFDQLGLAQKLDHHLGDIRDISLISRLVVQFQPDVAFHLAAQPLVRRSYLEPVETWQTNVMGTINVLEALKFLQSPCAVVMITTDKCYENREWVYGYRETDSLGGHDPYSSSKAGAELAIASWRKSFFSYPDCPIGIASARAGNVVGGGDWAEDRIVPDAMRALMCQEAISVRNPQATRPWQHVLEPLGGYLLLAQRIYEQLTDSKTREQKNELCSAFNFGPALSSNLSVKVLVEEILKFWTGSWIDCSDSKAVHEANLLNLVTDKAFHFLGWQPQWDFEQTIAETVFWYQNYHKIDPQDAEKLQALTLRQIQSYQVLLTKSSHF
jgi:CDP-glucose 4,6-dehydratase